ncbi:hypothetical protein J3F82_003947 [Coemansia sp. RSA 637]|nr:hypothetical protein J3F82_003947 [Coemansia sp. RSA 637]
MSTVAPNSDTARSSDWAFKQLFKLESKCRSPTPALQVEAIGEFPKLLDQFPFPTLVSSAFLKLGDLFRSSPNSLRYHIAQVFGASQQHLAQITQTEELLKRILVVLYSNDPIARVLALRLIGNASLIFAKFPEAQHSILLRYQSSHPLEIVAAVQTTESMLSYSPEFLEVVWETVLSKADDPDVPDSVRVQLIRSLQHAAPNLMLSTLLYSHCQHWACDTDSTNIIRCAAMDTWKAIIQRHNELQSVDAKHISGYVLHDLASLRRSALALLGKWKPKGQTVDASCLNEIQQRLTDCLHLPADSNMTIVGFGELRLAATVLARIEVACGNVNASQSWLAAYKYAARALEVFSDTTFATSSALSLNMSGQSSANDRPGIDPVYRLLISSVMLVINISTILDSSEYRSVTATIVRDSWLAITKRGESATALQDMVGSLSKPVTCQVINIVVKTSL